MKLAFAKYLPSGHDVKRGLRLETFSDVGLPKIGAFHMSAARFGGAKYDRRCGGDQAGERDRLHAGTA